MNNYLGFLLEKKLTDLILESKFDVFYDIRYILDNMKSPVAKELRKLIGTDIKNVPTYLGFNDDSDDPSSIKFYNKIQDLDWEVETTVFRKYDPKLIGLFVDDYITKNFMSGDKGKIVKVLSPDELKSNGFDYANHVVHFKRDSDGADLITSIVGLTPIKTKRAQKSSIGRISRRILDKVGKKFTQVEIDDFVNGFKALVELEKNVGDRIELVKGEDIRYWYLYERYTPNKSGTLHTSCMRYSKCQKYFGIYVDNPKVCQLLILKELENDSYIEARALVWRLSNGMTFMDRIYYSSPHQVDIIINYAKKMGWLYKSKQDSGEDTTILMPDGTEYYETLHVELNDTYFSYYPYMDTFKRLIHGDGLYSGDYSDTEQDMETTNGGQCEDCEGRGEIECSYCDGRGEIECGECDGEGSIECRDCDGDGDIECSTCDGYGEIECGECDGDSEIDCVDCGGDGEIDGEECSTCVGSGKSACDNCVSGKVECYSCSGSGEKKCLDCKGRGKIECDDCYNGSNECYNCEGSGNVECRSC